MRVDSLHAWSARNRSIRWGMFRFMNLRIYLLSDKSGIYPKANLPLFMVIRKIRDYFSGIC